jgi:hypothetical protein
MDAESIVSIAKENGVLLYQENGKLKFYGSIPANWLELTAQWLPFKPAVIAYLENPPWAHRVALAKAQAGLAKMRAGVPCQYLGKLIDPKPACGCGPLHECAKFGQCVTSGNSAKYRKCTNCPEYKIEA